MNSSQRTKFVAMDLNGFISILSRLIPSEMHPPNARNWNFAMRKWGSKNGAENLWTSYLKAQLAENGINNLGLGLGVNIWLIETIEIWKLRTSKELIQKTDFPAVFFIWLVGDGLWIPENIK